MKKFMAKCADALHMKSYERDLEKVGFKMVFELSEKCKIYRNNTEEVTVCYR